jgi:hypothetical protein
VGIFWGNSPQTGGEKGFIITRGNVAMKNISRISKTYENTTVDAERDLVQINNGRKKVVIVGFGQRTTDERKTNGRRRTKKNGHKAVAGGNPARKGGKDVLLHVQ